MIVQLDKMTLYGAESQKDPVIQRLQALGCAHLIDLGLPAADVVAADVSSDAREALKYLRSCPRQLRQVRRPEMFARERLVAEVLLLQGEARDASDRRDELQKHSILLFRIF